MLPYNTTFKRLSATLLAALLWRSCHRRALFKGADWLSANHIILCISLRTIALGFLVTVKHTISRPWDGGVCLKPGRMWNSLHGHIGKSQQEPQPSPLGQWLLSGSRRAVRALGRTCTWQRPAAFERVSFPPFFSSPWFVSVPWGGEGRYAVPFSLLPWPKAYLSINTSIWKSDWMLDSRSWASLS